MTDDGFRLFLHSEVHPAEVINAYYQNQSCDPFTPVDQPCELGNLAVYSINVTGASDVIAGLQFAQKNNVRLTVKNTGHEWVVQFNVLDEFSRRPSNTLNQLLTLAYLVSYMGKSTGQGALSLWMYNLKTTEVVQDYTSEAYSGPAIRLGSGVIGGEAIEAAAAFGYRMVGGECGSVGLAGGYTQGGGHSILNTAYGMAADNVLEWELVTATGEHLTASPAKNPDLYWALSGGGGGTYGVVLSMTAKLYADGPIVGGSLSFTNTEPDSPDSSFWKAVTLWFRYFPSFIGGDYTLQWVVASSIFDAASLNLVGETNISAVETLVAPFLEELDSLGINYTLTAQLSETYKEHFDRYYGPLPYGPEPPSTILSSRLIPRDILDDERTASDLVGAFRKTVEDGTFLVGCSGMNVTNAIHPDNAVMPVWRDAIAICNVNSYWNYTAPFSQNVAVKEELTSTYFPAIEEASPGGGVYLNEMDPLYKGDWKGNMYGENYERLLSIKTKYDPNHVLYGHFAVGGDRFDIDGSGRLCPLDM